MEVLPSCLLPYLWQHRKPCVVTEITFYRIQRTKIETDKGIFRATSYRKYPQLWNILSKRYFLCTEQLTAEDCQETGKYIAVDKTLASLVENRCYTKITSFLLFYFGSKEQLLPCQNENYNLKISKQLLQGLKNGIQMLLYLLSGWKDLIKMYSTIYLFNKELLSINY